MSSLPKCATLALGPDLLVNVALKDNWGRPRPGHLKQFGGDQHFVAWWDPTGRVRKTVRLCPVRRRRPFGRSHLPRSRRRWRALAYTAAIAFGVIISTSRMIMGGHFLSDTIFSGLFTLVISVVYALIYRRPRTRMDDAAVEMAIARFSIYGRTAIGRLLGY